MVSSSLTKIFPTWSGLYVILLGVFSWLKNVQSWSQWMNSLLLLYRFCFCCVFFLVSGFFLNSENLQWRSKEVCGLHGEKADATWNGRRIWIYSAEILSLIGIISSVIPYLHFQETSTCRNRNELEQFKFMPQSPSTFRLGNRGTVLWVPATDHGSHWAWYHEENPLPQAGPEFQTLCDEITLLPPCLK